MVAEPEDSAFVKSTQKTTNTTKAHGLKRMRPQDTPFAYGWAFQFRMTVMGVLASSVTVATRKR
jgi:hypothetical protein